MPSRDNLYLKSAGSHLQAISQLEARNFAALQRWESFAKCLLTAEKNFYKNPLHNVVGCTIILSIEIVTRSSQKG